MKVCVAMGFVQNDGKFIPWFFCGLVGVVLSFASGCGEEMGTEESRSEPEVAQPDMAEPEMVEEPEAGCEVLWVSGETVSIFAHEASRPDATVDTPGADSTAVCSRAGVLPWTDVSYDEATAACESIGARLCEGAEWNSACKGADLAIYPYGAMYEPETCNVLESPDGCLGECRLVATGVYERCVSAVGAFDMSGNAAEWVADQRPFGEEVFDIRGGSYFSANDNTIRCRNGQVWGMRNEKRPDLGFRCCR